MAVSLARLRCTDLGKGRTACLPRGETARRCAQVGRHSRASTRLRDPPVRGRYRHMYHPAPTRPSGNWKHAALHPPGSEYDYEYSLTARPAADFRAAEKTRNSFWVHAL